jgi:hypothetical protein
MAVDIAGALNFVRIHAKHRMSPAMAAGVTARLWEMHDIVAVIEKWEQRKEYDQVMAR